MALGIQPQRRIILILVITVRRHVQFFQVIVILVKLANVIPGIPPIKPVQDVFQCLDGVLINMVGIQLIIL